MDRREKERLKEEIGLYIKLSNGRFTDAEIETLYDLVINRDRYNGRSRTRKKGPYKSYDSSDTYWVTEEDTFTFVTDSNGIRIEEVFVKDWDDGQHDVWRETFDTARGILTHLDKIF